jgi:transposase
MTMGRAPGQGSLFHSTTTYCETTLGPTSIYRYLHEHCHRLFPDEMFADLFQDIGRESIPPRIVAVVMVLQRIEGLSDREAVDRFAYDLRWKYAAGGLEFDRAGFVHTVLVRMRAKLRDSERPNRIFEVALETAREAGLIGRKRAMDSTPLYDAVATQDTVTMIRSAIRGLLRAADTKLEAELRKALRRDDDYVSAGKPACDWSDEQARAELVDALCRDAYALLAVLDGRELGDAVQQASELLATVVGQDIEKTDDGPFRIARRVAKDRVISTVDPEARHGHKTSARGFDGYKGHISIDPDSEIITATAVTPGNVGDGAVAKELLAEALPPRADEPSKPETREGKAEADSEAEGKADAKAKVKAGGDAEPEASVRAAGTHGETESTPVDESASQTPPLEAYGDSSYGIGEVLAHLDEHGAAIYVKVQPPNAPKGRFPKDRFDIDLEQATVTCPQQHTVPIRRRAAGSGLADFGTCCDGCPLRAQCTGNEQGRTIRIHAQERLLAQARQQQRSDSTWQERYRATRPKVERKLAHLTRRKHGGRRARLRGRVRVAWDFALLAAATNLQRLAQLACPPPARVPAPATA